MRSACKVSRTDKQIEASFDHLFLLLHHNCHEIDLWELTRDFHLLFKNEGPIIGILGAGWSKSSACSTFLRRRSYIIGQVRDTCTTGRAGTAGVVR